MTFTEVTGPGFLETYIMRLTGQHPELTWLQQTRKILEPVLEAGTTLLDVGCGTGYAYNSFKDLDIFYTGIDVEPEFLKIAEEFFADCPRVAFVCHDISQTPIPVRSSIVITSATLEHCPKLMPALKHIVDAAEAVLVLRTFLGEKEDIHSIQSPVAQYAHTHKKNTNQYAFKDVLGYLESHGFRTRVHRDQYTGSVPQYVDQSVRTFFVVHAEKRRSIEG